MYQQIRFIIFWIAALVLISYLGMGMAFAQEKESDSKGEEGKGIEQELYFDLLPGHFVVLNGDDEKFRQMYWMNNEYVGGADTISGRFTFPEETSLELDGRALVGQNDYEGVAALRKPDLGFVSFEYSEFSHYYDGTGGVFYPYPLLSVNELDKELELEIGELTVEAGLTVSGFPETTLFYERQFKEGSKSRTTWAAITDSTSNLNMSIAPAYAEMDTTVDIFGLRASHVVNDYELSGEQRWEFVRSELFREDKEVCNTNPASGDCEALRQWQSPETNVMTTSARAERWFKKDTIHASSGYRYTNLRNRTTEEVRLVDGLGNIQINVDNHINARADNQLDTHTWVGDVTVFPIKDLSTGGKVKMEFQKRKSNSIWPQDFTVDGIVERTDLSMSDNHIVRVGENATLRYQGIPGTALYAETDFEQQENRIDEFRRQLRGSVAPGTTENFHRKTEAAIHKGVLTLGTHVAPFRPVSATVQGKYRWSNSDFDDDIEEPFRSPGRRMLSAFTDYQKISTGELSTRVKVRPFSWVTLNFRYQHQDDDLENAIEYLAQVKADTTSHIYTADVTLQPMDRIFVTGYFSRQLSTTSTIAQLVAAYQPEFKSDVDTWVASIQYVQSEHLVFDGTVLYSDADNFNDFSDVGLPLGSDFARAEASVGVRWTPRKHVSIEPKCSYYRYNSNFAAERNDYDAFGFFLEGMISLG